MINYVEKVKDKIKIKNVLVSVSDKTGLDELVERFLVINMGVRFISTGGTYKAIKDKMISMPQIMIGLPYEENNLLSVERYSGYPEMPGGLVKTLHPKIYAGILAEEFNRKHELHLKDINAKPIDLVICNLYPFKKTIAAKDATPEKARANIDIGGPSMVRAAAKNYHRVTVITDPKDYKRLIKELEMNDGHTTLKFRFEMHKKAFKHTAEYDTTIMKYNKKTKFKNLPYKIED